MHSTRPQAIQSLFRFLLPLSLLFASATAQAVVIDFESDGSGFPLSAGTVLTNQYSSLGVTISAISNGSHDLAMIFDSANPTGGDTDLGTPNTIHGGPGIGAGGASNDVALGNILIISEDGDASDPDDEARGGIIRIDFTSIVTMNSIGILDIDADEGEEVRLYDINDVLLDSFIFAKVGNNGFQNISLNNVGNVARMDVEFTGSGAITDFVFNPVPEPLTLSLFGLGLVGLGLARRRIARP